MVSEVGTIIPDIVETHGDGHLEESAGWVSGVACDCAASVIKAPFNYSKV